MLLRFMHDVLVVYYFLLLNQFHCKTLLLFIHSTGEEHLDYVQFYKLYIKTIIILLYIIILLLYVFMCT